MNIVRLDNVLDIELTNTVSIIYGNTLDTFFVPEDYQFLSLDKLLSQYLKANGFDIVVFYDAGWQLHCYDEETVNLFRAIARNQNSQSNDSSNEEYQSCEDGRPLGNMSLLNTKRINRTSSQEVNFENKDRTNTNENIPHKTHQGYYSLVSGEYNALEVLESLFFKTEPRTAVIISQFEESFITNSSRPQFFNRLTRWAKEPAKQILNRCFITLNSKDEEELAKAITGTSFLKNIFESCQSGEDRGGLVFLDTPGKDEIKALIHFYRLTKEKTITWEQFDNIIRWVERAEKQMNFWAKSFDHSSFKSFSVAAIKKLIKDEAIVTDEKPARQRLEEMVGLRKAKADIFKHINRLKLAREGILTQEVMPHMVFTGNPGTGKTTVARLVGEILEEEELLPKGNFVETNRAGLVAGYQGQTALKTSAVINRANRGVLFIDEAYSLIKDSENSFGEEAIDTLVPAMTNYADSMAVILAGYRNDINKLFEKANDGLKSRIGLIAHLDDYEPEELTGIFIQVLERSNRVIDPTLKDTALKIFKYIVNKERGAKFGNARVAEEVASQVIQSHVERCHNENLDIRNTAISDLDFLPAYRKEIYASSRLEEINPWEKLQGMVGLDNVKVRIKNFFDLHAYNQENPAAMEGARLHMVFMGNPGTGKTTVARLIGNIFKDAGILKRGHLVTANRENIVGQHIGHTEKNIKDLVNEALDGVLFIDEAYSLAEPEGSGFGKTAIDTLVPLMEDNRGRLMIILAGYPAQIEELIRTNPGLKSRFLSKNFITFDDYTPRELHQILDWHIRKKLLSFPNEVRQNCRNVLTNLYNNKGEDFGNARVVENLLIDMMANFAGRCIPQNLNLNETSYALEDIPLDYDQSTPPELDQSLDSLMDELNGLVGLKKVKEFIITLKEEYEFDGIIKRNKNKEKASFLPSSKKSLEHIIFEGNPGTGKTTVARLLGKIYRKLGLLKKGHIIETQKADLVAGYVGQTAGKMLHAINRARDGVLFIDEAYSLSESRDGFGKEAIDTLNKEMEDKRVSMLVVAAGYPKDMSDFTKSNSGLSSRFPHRLVFEDYTNEELCQIFESFASKEGFNVSEEVIEKLKTYFKSLPRGSSFGNARTARNVYQKCLRKFKSRTLKVFRSITEEERKELMEDLSFSVEDIPDPVTIGAQGDSTVSPIQRIPTKEIFKGKSKVEKKEKLAFYEELSPIIYMTVANPQTNDDEKEDSSLPGLQKEIQSINETLRGLQFGDKLTLYQELKPSPTSISKTFREGNGRIRLFHFAGHANEHGLYFLDHESKTKLADGKALANFFSHQENLDVVFLNGCSTQGQVNGLLEGGVKAVIATSASVGDDLASEFAQEFYENIKSNRPLKEAYEMAFNIVIEADTNRNDYVKKLRFMADKEQNEDCKLWDYYPNPLYKDVDDWVIPLKSRRRQLPQIEYKEVNIFGRDRDSNELKSILLDTNSAPAIWVWGDGGMGKSTFVRYFLKENLDEFSDTYWVNVQSTIARGLIEDVRLLNELGLAFPPGSGLDDRIKAVTSELNQVNENQNKIIVFDDYQVPIRPDLDIQIICELLDPSWKVIVISREKIPDYIAEQNFDEFEIVALERGEAIQLFQAHYHGDAKLSEIEALCQQMGNKPLPVELYAKLGESQKLPLSQLMGRIFEKPTDDQEWKTLSDIEQEIYLFIENEIPRLTDEQKEILRIWGVLPSRSFKEAELFQLFEKEEEKAQGVFSDLLIELLCNRGWVKENQNLFEMHALVQENIRKKLSFDENKGEKYILNLISLLKIDQFQPYQFLASEKDTWLKCADALLLYFKEEEGFSLFEDCSLNLLELKDIVAQNRFSLGEIEQAFSSQKKILEAYKNRFNEERPLFHARVLLNLARYHNLKAEYQFANKYLTEASSKISVSSGHLYLELLAMRTENYRFSGDFSSAKENARNAEKIAAEQFGRSNPVYFKFATDLASLLFHLENFEEAKKILDGIIEYYSNEEGDNVRIEKAYYLDVRGGFHLEEGELEEAKELFKESYTILKDSLGPDHLESLKVRQNLALALGELGELELAQSMIEEGLSYSKAIYGEEHPLIYMAQTSIGELARRMGKLDKAIEFAKKAEKTAEALALNGRISKNHPDFALIKSNSAMIQMERGEAQASSESLNKSIEAVKKKFGPSSPKVIEYLAHTANLQADLGKLSDAEQNLKEAYRLCRNRFDEKHGLFIHIRQKLGLLQILSGKPNEGIQNLQKGMESAQASELIDIEDKWQTKYLLSLGYKLTGKTKEAEELLMDLLEEVSGLLNDEDYNPIPHAIILSGIGEVKVVLGDESEALEYVNESIFLLRALGYNAGVEPFLCSALSIKAKALFSSNPEEAALHAMEASNIASQIYPPHSPALFEHKLNQALFVGAGDADSNIGMLKALIKESTEFYGAHSFFTLLTKGILASVFIEFEEYENADEQLSPIITPLHQLLSNNHPFMAEVYRMSYTVEYHHHKNYRNALKYAELSYKVFKKMNGEEYADTQQVKRDIEGMKDAISAG